MPKTLSIFVAVVCVFIFIGTVSAGAHKSNMHFGKVISVDAPANQFILENGKRESITIEVNATTRIIKEEKEITLSELAIGDSVKVKLNYDKTTAKSITVMKSQVEPKN